MLILNQKTLEMFNGIPWFKNVGNPNLEKEIAALELYSLSSKEDILNLKHRSLWKNAISTASGDITWYLSYYHEDIYNHEWNELGVECAEIFRSAMIGNFTMLYDTINIGNIDFLHHDEICICVCMMYFYYKDNLPYVEYQERLYSGFYEELFLILKNGLYPCGWVGGKYPRGNFLVY